MLIRDEESPLPGDEEKKGGGDVNTVNTDDGGQRYAQTDMLHVLLNLEPR